MCLSLKSDFVFQSALPGLVDQKEITAALRQGNYDPDEVISVYHTMFGDILLQPPPQEEITTIMTSTPSGWQLCFGEWKDHKITPFVLSPTTLESTQLVFHPVSNRLNLWNNPDPSYLKSAVWLMLFSTWIRSSPSSRLTSRSSGRRSVPPEPPSFSSPTCQTRHQACCGHGPTAPDEPADRELIVSNKHLRSVVHLALADIKNHLGQFEGPLGKLAQVEHTNDFRQELLPQSCLFLNNTEAASGWPTDTQLEIHFNHILKINAQKVEDETFPMKTRLFWHSSFIPLRAFLFAGSWTFDTKRRMLSEHKLLL